MRLAAIILPRDGMLLCMALAAARERGWILQTDGEHDVIAPKLLPHFARVTGGGTHTPAPDPEAA